MAKNLMIQGTMSGAGKSILTAGIIRVLTQDGYRTAPFKSQNMALNSFVTIDGGEMGRAQVVQAAAAKKVPSVDMNPILLKPMGDTTSQVIVNGKPISNMRATDYFKRKKDLIPVIKAAYDRLAEESDIIVLEGAGSPVEINLRENDIVNMGLAEIVDAPVLLAGNIDPGGVFAQLLGTVQLLSEEERKRVKGLIINKFRGDVSLLNPGLTMFKDYCDIPFAGIVPFIPLRLDEEDSLSERLGKKADSDYYSSAIKIAVIRLPHISNYSDFSAFESVESVGFVYTEEKKDIEAADLIIIPGTKNTIEDIKWLEEKGLAETIKKAADLGALIIGICGGYQMLGISINDENMTEGGGSARGLGLLEISTIFRTEKTLRQAQFVVNSLPEPWSSISGEKVTGYEIHMGDSSEGGDAMPVVANEHALGTYLHGFFDSEEVCRKLITILFERKKYPVPQFTIECAGALQERELDRLADVLRESLDWNLIYKAIGI